MADQNFATKEDKLLVSRKDAAYRLSISERAIDYLIAGKALSIKRIGKRVLIPAADLRRFASGNHPQRLAAPKESLEEVGQVVLVDSAE